MVFTYGFRLLEQFLIQEEFAEKKGLSKVFLLQRLRKQAQYEHYERTLRRVETDLEATLLKDSNFYHLQFISATEADAYYAQRSLHQKDLRIQAKQDNLDYFYLSQKLRDACEMLVRSNIIKVEYSTGLLEAIVHEISVNEAKYVSIPAITIYYRIYLLLVEQDVRYYHELLPLLVKHEQQLGKEELHNIYNYLQHYAAQELNRGKSNFLQFYFNIYKLQLEKGLLFENGFLSEWHYKNIVTAGVRLNETAWVRQFIEEYKSKISSAERENAYRFNLASYYYAIKNYDKVLEQLLTVEYKDIRYIQGTKALLLRTYYDLKEETALYSLIDSFRQYIKRDKNLSDSRKQGFSNLLRFTKRAFVLKTQADFMSKDKFAKDLQKLKIEIQATAPIFNQTWLLSKVEEL